MSTAAATVHVAARVRDVSRDSDLYRPPAAGAADAAGRECLERLAGVVTHRPDPSATSRAAARVDHQPVMAPRQPPVCPSRQLGPVDSECYVVGRQLSCNQTGQTLQLDGRSLSISRRLSIHATGVTWTVGWPRSWRTRPRYSFMGRASAVRPPSPRLCAHGASCHGMPPGHCG